VLVSWRSAGPPLARGPIRRTRSNRLKTGPAWSYEKGATAFAPLSHSGRFHACRAADVRERFAALLSSSGVVPWQQNLFLWCLAISRWANAFWLMIYWDTHSSNPPNGALSHNKAAPNQQHTKNTRQSNGN